MLKVAVFVSGGGTDLQSIIDACQNQEINAEIKVVVSSRKKAYGLERARRAGIQAEYIRDDDLLIQRLQEEEIELIVLAGYLAIVSERLIELYQNRIINIHPSLILQDHQEPCSANSFPQHHTYSLFFRIFSLHIYFR